jgi:exosortase/archaeosortase family protein
LSAIFFNRWWKKILLLGLSAVLAFVMNIFRSLFLTGWAYKYGSDALDADFWGHQELLKDPAGGKAIPNPAFHLITVHDFAGYAVLGLTLAGLLLLIPILNFKLELDDEPPAPSPKTPEPAPGGTAAPTTSA